MSPQGLAKFVRAVALGCEAVGVGLCSGEVLGLLKDWLLEVRGRACAVQHAACHMRMWHVVAAAGCTCTQCGVPSRQGLLVLIVAGR